MALLDLFRSQPGWKHADPVVRAEAVRHIAAAEQELLTQMARTDADPRVRRAAVRRLDSQTALLEVLRDESEASVQAEGREVLLARTLRSTGANATAALDQLTDPRSLTQLAKEAQLPDLRLAALARLSDGRSLSSLARTALDPAVRQAAVHKLEDQGLLLEVALKSDDKAVAVAAVERLRDDAALAEVARRARQKAATRRAQALVTERTPAMADPAPTLVADDADDLARWQAAEAQEQARLAALAREQDALAQALAEREGLISRLATANDPGALSISDADWEALPALPAEARVEFERRYADARAAFQLRQADESTRQAVRARLEALVVELEAVADVERSELGRLERQLAELRREGAADADLDPRAKDALSKLRAHFEQSRSAQAEQALANQARLEELCTALLALAKAPSLTLKEADLRLRAAREALAEPGPLPAGVAREALLKRLKDARAAVYPRFQEAREDAEWKRFAGQNVRETLLPRLAALAGESTPDKLDEALREIDRLWRMSGPVKEGDPLAVAFAEKRLELRQRADSLLAEQAEIHRQNRALKVALCEQAESLRESTDWKTTADALQKLQADWKQGGPVAREDSQKLWERFRAACDAFFTRRKADLDGRKRIWTENLHKKQALVAKAEELQGSSDWEATAAALKRLQSEWKQIGAVKPQQSEAIWKRFRAACDAFFERYKQRDQLDLQGRTEACEAVLVELEALEGTDPADLGPRFLALQTRWRETSSALPAAAQPPLEQRFFGLRSRLIELHPAAFRGTDLDPDANYQKRERLCERVEALAGRAEAEEGPKGDVSLADQLRSALVANALGGRAEQESRLKGLHDELLQLRAAFSRIGPVAGEPGAALNTRFEQAAGRINRVVRAQVPRTK